MKDQHAVRSIYSGLLRPVCGALVVAVSSGCGPEGAEDSNPDDLTAPGVAEQSAAAASSRVDARRAMLKAYFAQRRSELPIVATTRTRYGQLLDWIPRDSQVPSGAVETPPPPPDGATTGTCSDCLTGDELGPEGTVPILRRDTDDFLGKIDPPPSVMDFLSKYGLATGSIEAPGTNLHAASDTLHSQNISATDANFPALAPFTARNDEFSLTQVWVQGLGSNNSTKDSVESGVQKYQTLYGDQLAHFFVFFTNNGYVFHGDYWGGYNQDVKGWVQVSSNFFPGHVLGTGDTYTQVLKSGSAWWVWSGSAAQWVGYYPTSLFTTPGLKAAGDVVSWGGEVVDATADGVTTATDMGTGKYCWESGAAKIRNIRWRSSGGVWQNFDKQFYAMDKSNCWNVEDHSNSGTTDGSYLLYGGPGNNPYFCP